MKFDEILKNQVDMERVDLESVKPWISKRITGLLKHEDEVLIEYVFNQLEPKFPNPKEIQGNLSGFLSLSNARIFIAELWSQLLNSMGLNETRKNSNKKITNDKIKSFPRLGPSDKKQSSNDIVRNESIERNEARHNRHNRSESQSFSSEYNERDRSQSNSNYSYPTDHRHRSRNRSQIKSSNRYTPYTRQSRFSDSYETNSSSNDSSSRSSSSSTSESSLSQFSQFHNSYQKKQYSTSFKSNSPSAILPNCNSSFHEANESNSESYRENQKTESDNDVDSSYPQSQTPDDGTSVSESKEFVRAENEMSPKSDTSSSDYSIEYMDKSLLLQLSQSKSEVGSEEEIIWITNEEYERMTNENKSMHSRTQNSSPTDSCDSSDYSFSDIEWVEKCQLDYYLSGDYLEISSSFD